MRRVGWLVVLVALDVGSVAGRADALVDGIGIFLDQAGTAYCGAPAPYTSVTLYVVSLNVSEPSGISAWEAGIFTDPESLPVPPVITVPNCSSGCELPNVRVCLSTPLPAAPAIVLATLGMFYLGGPVKFGLGSCAPTSFPDDPGPGYAVGNEPTRLVRMHIASNVPAGSEHPDGRWVFYMNVGGEPCPSSIWPAVETTSWSLIKQMYRR